MLPATTPHPAEPPRLAQIRDNLIARIAEADSHRWFGEAEGLKVSLAGARAKLAEMDQITARRNTDRSSSAYPAFSKPPAAQSPPAKPIPTTRNNTDRRPRKWSPPDNFKIFSSSGKT